MKPISCLPSHTHHRRLLQTAFPSLVGPTARANSAPGNTAFPLQEAGGQM